MHSKLTRQLIQLEPKWNHRLRNMDDEKRNKCLEVMRANKIPIDDGIKQMARPTIQGPSPMFNAVTGTAATPQTSDILKQLMFLLHTPLKIGVVYFCAKLIFGSEVPFNQIPFFTVPPKLIYPLVKIRTAMEAAAPTGFSVSRPFSLFLSVVNNLSVLRGFVFGGSSEQMGSFAIDSAPFNCKVVTTFGVITSWMLMAMALKQVKLQVFSKPSCLTKISRAVKYACRSLMMSESTKTM